MLIMVSYPNHHFGTFVSYPDNCPAKNLLEKRSFFRLCGQSPAKILCMSPRFAGHQQVTPGAMTEYNGGAAFHRECTSQPPVLIKR
jgi:hypothetical protein